MIEYNTARQIALARIGPEKSLIDEASFEKPYGWYFFGQSNAYLETGNVLDMIIGDGGFIVERQDGRVFAFGSAYPVETWIANYEKGFKYESYDLIIRSVRDWIRTIYLLHSLSMNYVVPEVTSDVAWKTPEQYTIYQLGILLTRLPCVFTDQRFWHRVDVFDEMDRLRCCEYELREYK